MRKLLDRFLIRRNSSDDDFASWRRDWDFFRGRFEVQVVVSRSEPIMEDTPGDWTCGISFMKIDKEKF